MEISANEFIPTHISKSYMSHNTDLPIFYHLIKTHKDSKNLKIRPIVSNMMGPSKKISWLLCRILSPVYDLLPSHLESSAQLINNISKLESSITNEFNYPFSLDVQALYTSIPPQEAIRALKNKLEKHNEIEWTLKVKHI